MDELLKGKVTELIKKVQAEPALLQKILANPATALKEMLGVDLPEAQVKSVTNALQSGSLKIEGVDLSDGVDMKDVQGIAGKFGDLLK